MAARMGPHCQGSNLRARQWASVASVVKQMDGTDLLAAAPSGATTIFRHWYPGADIARNGGDVAREVIAACGGFKPTYIELYNEAGYGDRVGQGLERYVQFHREAVPVAHAAGIKVMGYSFGTGSPEAGDWKYLADQGWGNVDAVGIHEYWAERGFTIWNALRHRQVIGWTNGRTPPDGFYITECGRDRVRDGDNGEYIGVPGYVGTGLSAQMFGEELLSYANWVGQDSYIKGVTPFTCAPNAMWTGFDCDPVVPFLLGLPPDPICDPACCLERTDCLVCPNAKTCYPPIGQEPVPAWLVGLGIGALFGGLALAITTPRYQIGKKFIYYDKRTIPAGGQVPPGFVIVK